MLVNLIDTNGIIQITHPDGGVPWDMTGTFMPTEDYEAAPKSTTSLKTLLKLKREGFSTADIVDLEEAGLLHG